MTFLRNTDFMLEVAKGNITGHRMVYILGRNDDIDPTTDPEDLWLTGGLFDWPTSAGTISVVSSSTADDGDPTSNTGAHTITIEGLDSSFDEITETITLNGTSAVTTSASFIRVNKVFVATSGVYNAANVGLITGTLSGATSFAIRAGTGIETFGRYTVPNGKTCYLLEINLAMRTSGDPNPVALVIGFEHPGADDVTTSFVARREFWRYDIWIGGSKQEIFDASVKFTAKTDIWFNANFVVFNNTVIDLRCVLVEVDD